MTKNQHPSEPGPDATGVPAAGLSAKELTPAQLFSSWVTARFYGIRILQHIYESRLSKEQLLLVGLDIPMANKLIKAANVFWGPTRRRKVQAAIVAMAEEKQLPIEALIGMATQFNQLIPHDRLDPSKILANLVETAEGPTVNIVDTAKERIKNINRQTRVLKNSEAEEKGVKPDLPKGRLFFDLNEDARGQSRMTLIDDSAKIAALEAALEPEARRLMRGDASLDIHEAQALAYQGGLRSKTEAGAHVTTEDGTSCSCANPATTVPPFQPLLIALEDDFNEALANKKADKVFALTNNTTVMAAQLHVHGVSDHQYVQVTRADGTPVELFQTQPKKIDQSLQGVQRQHALMKTLRPVAGKLNNGRTIRSINKKQRIVATGMTATCAWPGCNVGANVADGHHLKSWLDDGPTDIDNITMLCRRHNGMNDDHRDRPKNGYVFMKDWEIYFQPPEKGAEPIPRWGAITRLTSVALARRRASEKSGTTDQVRPNATSAPPLDDQIDPTLVDEPMPKKYWFEESEGPPPF